MRHAHHRFPTCWPAGRANGLLKPVVDACDEKLLGVHIVGERASELIHIGQLVMNFYGTVRDLVSNAFN